MSLSAGGAEQSCATSQHIKHVNALSPSMDALVLQAANVIKGRACVSGCAYALCIVAICNQRKRMQHMYVDYLCITICIPVALLAVAWTGYILRKELPICRLLENADICSFIYTGGTGRQSSLVFVAVNSIEFNSIQFNSTQLNSIQFYCACR